MTVPDDSQRIEDHHYIFCLLQPPLPPSLLDLGLTGPVSEQAEQTGGNKTNSSRTARARCSPALLPDFHRKKNNRKNWLRPAKTLEIKNCKWNT